MKVTVDQETCIGCGLCAQVAPDVYEMQGDKAVVAGGEVAEDKAEEAQNGSDQCPVAAISIS
ncbi:MAG: ferredoxin [Candidatus Omnitrophica bacterium]|nr:ferredoxin [Candidatus Omnitrophota bacterium]